MIKDLDHDEHQFIASAYLYAVDNQLPYVDYPYFHMPNLIFVYALLFKFTSYRLFIARYFSVICAVFTVALLYWTTFYLFIKQSLALRFVMGLCAMVLLLADPLFNYVAGLAWNHDLSVFLALLSTVVFVLSYQKSNLKWGLFFSGLLLSLSIGVRASWGVIVPPFLLAICVYQKSKSWRTIITSGLLFSSGGVLGMVPSIVLFIMAPAQFVFGNLGYPQLNALYRQKIESVRPMTLGSKINFFLTIDSPGFGFFLFIVVFIIFGLSLVRLIP